jgi:hypothetical protein
MTTQTRGLPPRADVAPQASILERAKQHDPNAIRVMFRQFVPENEDIIGVEFLGTQGVWGLGTHSFACVTDRRIAALKVKLFGEMTYQDGTLDAVNSGVIYQPSKLLMYLFVAAVSILTFGLGLLLLPLTVRLFYSFKKSGLVLSVREGISVYVFSDRKLLGRANALYRTALTAREGRVRRVQSDGRSTYSPHHGPESVPYGQPATQQTVAAPEPARYPHPTAARALAWGGAILVALAIFLPYGRSGSETVSILDTSDWSSLWFVFEPLGVAVVAAFAATKLLGKHLRLAPGLFVAFGLQTFLLFAGYVATAIDGDFFSPALGGWAGLAGASLLVWAGLASQSADASWRDAATQPTHA